MTILTEGNHPGEFILSEGNVTISREKITVLLAEVLKAGEVVAKVTKAGGTGAAVAGNTGDGTIGAITVAAGNKLGVYKVTFIEPAANLGTFEVEDPDGINVGTGVVASAFTGGGITFTIADGAADFVAGDQFDITIAAGSNKFVAFNQDGTNGSEVAAGILFDAVDATAADTDGVMIESQR